MHGPWPSSCIGYRTPSSLSSLTIRVHPTVHAQQHSSSERQAAKQKGSSPRTSHRTCQSTPTMSILHTPYYYYHVATCMMHDVLLTQTQRTQNDAEHQRGLTLSAGLPHYRISPAQHHNTKHMIQHTRAERRRAAAAVDRGPPRYVIARGATVRGASLRPTHAAARYPPRPPGIRRRPADMRLPARGEPR